MLAAVAIAIGHLILYPIAIMLSTKQKIIKNFAKRALSYTAAADIQASVAEQLAAKVRHMQPQTILEVGCGTGLLSQRLIQLFPQASLLLTDAASAMLEQCRNSLSSHPRVDFACMDGEQLAVTKQYALIISSMTLHWFLDLQRSFIDITQHLQRGGEFIFSMLGENSFKEWRTVCQKFNVPVATPLFPAEHLLQTMLPRVQIEVVTYQRTYTNAYAFLRSLKNIGATVARLGYVPLPSGKLRQVLRQCDTELTISYEVLYGRYRRR